MGRKWEQLKQGNGQESYERNAALHVSTPRQSHMLLFRVRLGFSFRVAGQNIRAFPISGKLGTLAPATFRQAPRHCDCENQNCRFSNCSYPREISK